MSTGVVSGIDEPGQQRPQLSIQAQDQLVHLSLQGADGSTASGSFERADLLQALSPQGSPAHRFDGYSAHPDRAWRQVRCLCTWTSVWSDRDLDNDNDLRQHLRRKGVA